MRILLDEGFARSTAGLLRSAGHDAVHVADLTMTQAEDTAVIRAALAEARVVVTLDADFHTLLFLSGAAAPSVMRIRIEGLKAPEAAALIARIVGECESDLAAGAAVSVDERQVRVRRLPIAP